MSAAQLEPLSLDALQFDNRFVRELPADPETENHRRQVHHACYTRVRPAAAPNPQLVAYSREMAKQLGLSPEECGSERFVRVFAGNELLPGMDPYAMCYGGHQFGNWARQLGDGRAINLGEALDVHGNRQTLQLKGAGATPYSRMADGLAVLRSSIREFLCSEAMHHLGVPTTRALCIVTTGDSVIRDMFYDGNPKQEPGAVVCRVSPSFIRFGSFEIFTARQDYDTLRKLLDFTIRNDFPHLGEPGRETYITWFREVCKRTAELIVHWQRVGFVHGVMNTDNMSVLGETIDYGPYGWLDDYDPNWTPNTTDATGRRYRYGAQPQIAMWNLAQLGNAIYPLIEEKEPLEDAITLYAETFSGGWQTMMAHKLGLQDFNGQQDEELIGECLQLLAEAETDMTLFFRQLADIDIGADPESVNTDDLMLPLMPAYYRPEQITDELKARTGKWLRAYIQRSRQDNSGSEKRRRHMHAVNPKYVLRNYMAQMAIDRAEQGDHSLVVELLDLLRHPYDEQPEREQWYARRPDWARNRPGCSMLSCSS